jgi:glycosyltransferase involved in cell wall biosynthesis
MKNKYKQKISSFYRKLTSIRLKPFLGWPHVTFWQNKTYDSNIEWPKLSIITPSFNQAKYIEQTILSVINQSYPNLEYIIIDGGSTDGSVEIIKKYEKYIDYWEAKEDQGQSHAINKGMSHATGEWVAWINSDDYYLPNSFKKMMRYATTRIDESWIVGNTFAMENIFWRIVKLHKFKTRVKRKGLPIPNSEPCTWLDFVCRRWTDGFLPQPSSFWKRDIWQKVSGLDKIFHYIMDLEFFGRLAYQGYRPSIIDVDVAIFRRHETQKTSDKTPGILEEVKQIEKWMSSPLSSTEKSILSRYKTWLKQYKL